MFDQVIARLGAGVSDFGKNTAGHATHLSARKRGECADGIAAPGAGHKEYIDDDRKGTHLLEWFGYKLHVLCDTRHEVAFACKITPASAADNEQFCELNREILSQGCARIHCLVSQTSSRTSSRTAPEGRESRSAGMPASDWLGPAIRVFRASFDPCGLRPRSRSSSRLSSGEEHGGQNDSRVARGSSRSSSRLSSGEKHGGQNDSRVARGSSRSSSRRSLQLLSLTAQSAPGKPDPMALRRKGKRGGPGVRA